jgi:hypothetical protein
MVAYQYVGYSTTGGVPSQAEMVAAMAHVEQGHGFPENRWATLKTKCNRKHAKTMETTLNTDIFMMLDLQL